MDLDVGIIDLQVSVYETEQPEVPVPRALLRDEESLRSWPSIDVVQYMYGNVNDRKSEATDPESVLRLLDKWHIERAQVAISAKSSERYLSWLDSHSDRFFATMRLDPHDGYGAVRTMNDLAGRFGWVRSVSIAPAILHPPIPADSAEFYPIYTKCIEYDIPVCINVGFPGPRVPGEIQNPMYIEKVAWFFPELRVVMKHGGQPWPELCVRLMRKWSNVYYVTTGYAPKRYPAEVITYLQGSGSHKILYGGYYPSVSLDRIMGELAAIDLPREKAERFLRTNAIDVFRLGKSG